MRLAYATTDEVNRALATQMAAACGAVVCLVRPGEAPPAGVFDAVLYNLDDVPSDQRPGILDGLCLDPTACPTAVHGYSVTDREADALRRCGVAVARRIESGLVRRLCKAAQPRLATVPLDDTLTELTWVNVIE
jgi:hypothetical protein